MMSAHFKRDQRLYSRIEHKKFLMGSILLFYVLMEYKLIFLFGFILFLEFGKSYLNKSYAFTILPIPILEIGLICMSYYYSPLYGMFFIPGYLLIKLCLGKLKLKYFIKAFSILVVAFMASLFHKFPLLLLGPSLYSLRIGLETAISSVVLGDLQVAYLPKRMLNIGLVIIFFLIFQSSLPLIFL